VTTDVDRRGTVVAAAAAGEEMARRQTHVRGLHYYHTPTGNGSLKVDSYELFETMDVAAYADKRDSMN